jgi:hypothetical protein
VRAQKRQELPVASEKAGPSPCMNSNRRASPVRRADSRRVVSDIGLVFARGVGQTVTFGREQVGREEQSPQDADANEQSWA